ncbi:MAG: diacylglycerol kinase family protein [Planctomycetia bacterium]|nr:diacylglycerol kinase family protein [Planctomycetia bacterium]
MFKPYNPLEIAMSEEHVLISVNPKAGRKSSQERAEILKTALEDFGFKVELHDNLDIVAKRANELMENKLLRALVGVGGDGTAAELTNRTKPGTPITLLPAGTANLIAKYLKLPSCPRKLASVINEGATITFDAGNANGRLFLVMVSAGIDADVVRRVHAMREENYRLNKKKGAHISYCSYIKPIFQSIASYRYSRIKMQYLANSSAQEVDNISVDERFEKNQEYTRQLTGKWGFVFNLPRYGWGLPLVPKCIGNDKKLDYCLFQGGRLCLALLDVAFAQFFSAHRILPNARLGQSGYFRLTVANSTEPGEVPYQIDGDPGGVLPLNIEVIPNRFTVVAPQKTVARLQRKKSE